MDLLTFEIKLRTPTIPIDQIEMVEAFIERLSEFTEKNDLRFRFLDGNPIDAGWVPYAKTIRCWLLSAKSVDDGTRAYLREYLSEFAQNLGLDVTRIDITPQPLESSPKDLQEKRHKFIEDLQDGPVHWMSLLAESPSLNYTAKLLLLGFMERKKEVEYRHVPHHMVVSLGENAPKLTQLE
jgi:hypothetical protein